MRVRHVTVPPAPPASPGGCAALSAFGLCMPPNPGHAYWLRRAMRARLEADERLAMLDVCIANHRANPRKLLRLATVRAAALAAVEDADREVTRLGGDGWMHVSPLRQRSGSASA